MHTQIWAYEKGVAAWCYGYYLMINVEALDAYEGGTVHSDKIAKLALWGATTQ